MKTPRAEAKLPEGGPTDRGLPLDSGIGTRTFVKPVDDTGESKPKDESIYRVDSPRDLAKDRDRIDVKDWSGADTSYGGVGESDSGKTKYPYRDGIPNTHNASVYVAEAWLLERSPHIVLTPGVKVAADLGTIKTRLNPKVTERSQQCQVMLKRADNNNLRWIFSVDCGNGAKLVKLKADRKGTTVKLSKMDLHLACSCPAWRWQGPEFHSTTKDYQDPRTPLQGTATPPNIRDPQRVNKVCKHVAAVLSTTQNWSIPKRK